MNDHALAELGQERLQLTLEALDRMRKAGAKQDDIELLARELGVFNYMKGKQHEPVKSY